MLPVIKTKLQRNFWGQFNFSEAFLFYIKPKLIGKLKKQQYKKLQ
jgi:hypothetical protein